ncbi:acyl-CoA dehydrogenase, partial [Mycobacterium sp. ITM-2017-0098]
QFGRQIGSFQALKHMAADLLLEVESATSAAQNAAAQIAATDNTPEARDGAVALAGFACAEAFATTTMTAVQMHGGIGFTWEHPAHLYVRRARSGLQLFGDSASHRERYLLSKGA